MSFFLRWLFALFLVGVTYNPTPVNFARWAEANWQAQMPLTALFGVLLLIGWIIYLRATLRSIGPLGMILVLALVGTILWVLWDYGLIDLSDPRFATWIGILALSLVLGVGLSWSIIRRRLSGQADVDDVDET
ncbi:DUF6524 family protein [Thetidibacter halocola]|uniref:Uncharacterized protein n=1 Tax=Thetidibacter halocola TaxID=2827239 RepID=A0A8J7WDJ6_9RHOB|nr:DUF6524 family protein [Thetidibacter halocola]MBS0123219.1 hypothetical protein [Thetidibacter halocola]